MKKSVVLLLVLLLLIPAQAFAAEATLFQTRPFVPLLLIIGFITLLMVAHHASRVLTIPDIQMPQMALPLMAVLALTWIVCLTIIFRGGF